MAITRQHHVGNYTVVDNGFVRDERLTLKAKGMLLLLLSLPDNWKFTETWLATQCQDQVASVKSALKDLEANGYLKRSRERNDGKLGDAVYDVYEAPMCDFQTLENPTLGNRALLNTNNTELFNNNIPSTNNTNSAIEEIVSYLNQKADKKYRASSKQTASLIKARLSEGFKVDDFKKVIDNKVADWKPRKDMERYLRPETLFGTKFEGYLNENKTTSSKPKEGYRRA